MKGLRRALTQEEREIVNYTRAIARGDFASLETALTTAEQRRRPCRLSWLNWMDTSSLPWSSSCQPPWNGTSRG